MLPTDNRGYRMKISVPDMRDLPYELLVMEAFEAPQTTATAITLGYPPEVNSKTLLLQIQHIIGFQYNWGSYSLISL